MIEDYEQGALGKDLVIVLFVKQLKTINTNKSNWQISLVLTVICWNILYFVHLLLIQEQKQGIFVRHFETESLTDKFH